MEWAALALGHLARYPNCVDCERMTGRITPATVPHHIVPVRLDPSRRLDPSNLVSLCNCCHQRRHAEMRNAGQ